MSHFSVLVKISKARLDASGGGIESAVEDMLAPYKERADLQYAVFEDCTQEVIARGNEVVTADNSTGIEDPEHIGSTLLQVHGSLAEVAEAYFGYCQDASTGGYGYYKNPNAKWDWYVIGGRWAGLLRVKANADGTNPGNISVSTAKKLPNLLQEGRADCCKVKELDWDSIEAVTVGKIKEFQRDYKDWLSIKDLTSEDFRQLIGDDGTSGSDTTRQRMNRLRYTFHEDLLEMGLGKLVEPSRLLFNADGTPLLELIVSPLGTEKSYRQVRSQPVYEYAEATEEELNTKYRWYFEFGTFAVLSDDGWKGKGEMGWWGASSDTLEARQKWYESYRRDFLDNEDPDTTLVVVDCHI
jgi:hypothetical protein